MVSTYSQLIIELESVLDVTTDAEIQITGVIPSATSVTVNWTYSRAADVEDYDVTVAYHDRCGDPGSTPVRNIGVGTAESAFIDNLEEYTEYYVTVQAHTILSTNPAPASTLVSTLPAGR